MLVTVEVAVALSRPPREDEWRKYVVEAQTPNDGEIMACQMAAVSPGVVMPVRSRLVSWLDSTERVNPGSYAWDTVVDGTLVRLTWIKRSRYLRIQFQLPSGKWTASSELDHTTWRVDGTLDDARRKANEFLTQPFATTPA